MTAADARRLIGRLGVSKQRSFSDSLLQLSTKIISVVCPITLVLVHFW